MYIFDFLSKLTGFNIPTLGTYIGVFSILYYILLVIALWKIFEKANESGIKAIIPLYNFIVLFKIIGLSPWYILIFLLLLVPNMICYIVFLLCFFILKIVFAIDMAHSFGRGFITVLGLIFLPSIFYIILGYGSAVYEGPYGEKH